MQQHTDNLYLDALSPESSRLLLKHSTRVFLPPSTILFSQEETPAYAYFLTSGIASTITTTPTGDSAEVGIIGHEGVVGSLHLLGPAKVPAQSMVQIEAEAFRIPLVELKRIFDTSEEIRNRLLEFLQNELLTTIQIAGCHRLHGTEERLARWLLMVEDRVKAAELKLTHSFLALMLGARRPTVTLVARALQKRGLLELHRGSFRISDRSGLEAVSCDCYQTARDLYNALYNRRVK